MSGVRAAIIRHLENLPGGEKSILFMKFAIYILNSKWLSPLTPIKTTGKIILYVLNFQCFVKLAVL